MHDIEVDQSGRTDTLTVDTALAFSNDIQSVILIPKTVKRECYQLLRDGGMRKDLISVKLFAAGLILLLAPHVGTVRLITIDLEYPGWENEIKEQLLRHLRKRHPELSNRQIAFGQVGKKSNSHEIALATYRREKQPDKQVRIEEMLEVII
ncbi:MAG: hypothetical protein ACE5LU_26605 [Anaerolineae bacterium]